ITWIVIYVEPAFGASVFGTTIRLATTNTATSTTIGMTMPKRTTRRPVAPSFTPRNGSPSRLRRIAARTMRSTAPPNTTDATPSIHHQSVDMSRAGPLSGARGDWLPPQPAMAIAQARGARRMKPIRARSYPRGARITPRRRRAGSAHERTGHCRDRRVVGHRARDRAGAGQDWGVERAAGPRGRWARGGSAGRGGARRAAAADPHRRGGPGRRRGRRGRRRGAARAHRCVGERRHDHRVLLV